MDKKQFSIFASALRTYYPKEKLIPNEQAMALWYNQLKDIPYQIAEVVLNKWVATNKWSPSIADIREQASQIVTAPIKDWGDAWNDVLKSIHTYGYYNMDEGLNSLDDVTRQVVKRMGYDRLCMSDNSTADRANFRMIYEQVEQRQRQDAQIPIAVKELIQQIGANNIKAIEEAKT